MRFPTSFISIDFWANFIQKVKIVALSWSMASRPMRTFRKKIVIFNFSVFDLKHLLKQNLSRKLKLLNFDCYIDLNIQNPMVKFIFWLEIRFLSNFFPKCQISQFNKVWLYIIIMLRTSFRVYLHSIVP